MKIHVGPTPPFGEAPPKQPGRPPPTPEEVIENAALAEAILAVHNSNRPSNRQLSRLAVHLLTRPDLRKHPVMNGYLELILYRFAIANEPSDPGPVAAGLMVEFWDRDKTNSSLRKARRRVAGLLKMSASTLREACRVFRNRYRSEEKASGMVAGNPDADVPPSEEKASGVVAGNPDADVPLREG